MKTPCLRAKEKHQSSGSIRMWLLFLFYPWHMAIPSLWACLGHRDSLHLSCIIERPKDTTLPWGLRVPSASWDPEDTQHQAEIKSLPGPWPTHGCQTCSGQVPLHLVSSVPKKLKQSFYTILRHNSWASLGGHTSQCCPCCWLRLGIPFRTPFFVTVQILGLVF